jgi:hypothetical protein
MSFENAAEDYDKIMTNTSRLTNNNNKSTKKRILIITLILGKKSQFPREVRFKRKIFEFC